MGTPPEGPSRRITLADVGRAAGVSSATVSYVLNDVPNQKISEATRARIRRAVEELGYTRSAAARALSTGRGDTVLLVLPPWPIGPLIAEVIDGLTDDLGRQGLSLVTRRELPQRSVAALWRELAPAAVIYFGEVDVAERQAMRRAGTYVTSISGQVSDDAADLVTSTTGSGPLQVAYLAAAGHRRLGVAVPTDPRLGSLPDGRLAGIRAACAAAGLPAPDVRPVALDVAGADAAVAAWHGSVTAVCAYNDEVAFAVLHGMRRAGLRAPSDLAVIGVDDIPTAPFADPPLTTVKQDIAAITAHVSRLVGAGIAGAPPPPHPTRDFLSVVSRESA
ncbi:LacI family DNA-binding transcriptional regulator [Pseudonocardia sp. GCM10023141]|uniref:LacI family DNA-binding transcriptional regulator n=1 Tax=Pseudonocardia sp. GCM10023141 TaxID=3252653 RepID=UPI003611CE5C